MSGILVGNDGSAIHRWGRSGHESFEVGSQDVVGFDISHNQSP